MEEKMRMAAHTMRETCGAAFNVTSE